MNNATKTDGRKKVVTWSDSRGDTINVCPKCQAKNEADGTWPKNPATGQEYCQVSHGLHSGYCDECD